MGINPAEYSVDSQDPNVPSAFLVVRYWLAFQL